MVQRRSLGDLGGGTILFAKVNGAGIAEELWKTDASPAGATRLATGLDLQYKWTNSLSSGPGPWTAVAGGRFYFVSGGGLWQTDGTTVSRVLDAPGIFSPDGYQLTTVGNAVYYVSYTGSQITPTDLWRTDGTVAGTYAVLKGADMDVGEGVGLSTRNLTPFNGKLAFEAWDYPHGYELWTSDGTVVGTTRPSPTSHRARTTEWRTS